MSDATALLFDLDGTLLDSKPGIAASFLYACEQTGLEPPDAATLHSFIGPPLQAIVTEHYGIDDAAFVARFVAAYRSAYLENGMFEAEVYPGIRELLTRERHRATLFVATSKPRVHARTMLEHFGLAEHFTAVHGSELDGARFDKTELIGHILETESLDCVAACMIGDRRYDMVGARDNRVEGIGVLWGYGSRAELAEAGARHFCETAAALSSCLGQRAAELTD